MNKFLYLYLFLTIRLFSQNFEPYHYVLNTENGLPTNTVFYIKQTKKGSIYIGHDEGISRFNGKEFIHLSNKGKGKALNGIAELDSNTILAASFYGDLVRINGTNVSVHGYSYKEKSGKPTIKQINNRIFVYERCNLYEYVSGVLIPFSIPFNKQYVYIQDVDIDENNNVVLVLSYYRSYYVLKYNQNPRTASVIKCGFDYQSLVRFLKLKNRLYIYFFDNHNLLEVEKNTLKESSIKIDLEYKFTKWHTLLKLDDKNVAVLGFDGMALLDENGVFKRHILKGIQVSYAIKDMEGNLWVSTLNDGIYVFPSLEIESGSLQDVLEKNDFVNKTIRLKDGKFLLGTFKGNLICYDGHEQAYHCFDFGKNAEVQAFYYDYKTELIYAFCDKLFVINASNLKIVETLGLTATKDVRVVNNQLYCATSAHLVIPKKQAVITKFENTWINSLEYDSLRNVLWLGSNKGLLKYDLEKDLQEKIDIPIKDMSVSLITKVIKDEQGNVFLLLSNYGIIKLTRNNTFETVFKNNHIRNFRIDQTEMFVITKTEVFIVNTKTNKVTHQLNNAKELDPFVIDIYKLDSVYYAFYPKGIKKFYSLPAINTVKPNLHLSEVKGTYKFIKALNLLSDFDRNNLEFSLEILPNIRSKNSAKISYRLVDVDEKWIVLNPDESDFRFKYQNLNSGKYLFQAKAINEDGVESDLLQLTFEIKPPFWKKWWFILIEAIALLCLFLSVYLWRVNIINKRNREKIQKQINEIKLLSAELTAIRSQMNPHFIFNTLSSIQAKVLSSKSEDAYNDISKFSQLIRSVLDYSSREFILLKNEIDFIRNYLYLESSRFDGKINYEVNVAPKLELNFIEIPTLITIPFIENSIKHGLLHKAGDKKLEVNFKGNNENLLISIKDNGVGRIKSEEINRLSRKEHVSFATEAMNKRVERINQSGKFHVSIETIDLEEGVEVIIKITY